MFKVIEEKQELSNCWDGLRWP